MRRLIVVLFSLSLSVRVELLDHRVYVREINAFPSAAEEIESFWTSGHHLDRNILNALELELEHELRQKWQLFEEIPNQFGIDQAAHLQLDQLLQPA